MPPSTDVLEAGFDVMSPRHQVIRLLDSASRGQFKVNRYSISLCDRKHELLLVTKHQKEGKPVLLLIKMPGAVIQVALSPNEKDHVPPTMGTYYGSDIYRNELKRKLGADSDSDGDVNQITTHVKPVKAFGGSSRSTEISEIPVAMKPNMRWPTD